MDLILLGAVLVPLAWVFATISVAFTAAHTIWDEWFSSGGPFWDYYRKNFGRGVGDLIGYPLFVLLALTLTALAVPGYLFGSRFFLGVLIGARVGDSLLSHAGLRLRFKGPNPGLITSALYLVEAALAPWFFAVSLLGFAVGFSAFASFWAFSFLFRKREETTQ